MNDRAMHQVSDCMEASAFYNGRAWIERLQGDARREGVSGLLVIAYLMRMETLTRANNGR